ncbi:MAG: leucine--tRNA ligase [Bacilli bacterium]|nr:leucine--tRNA ligase [Bacilli bacterium]
MKKYDFNRIEKKWIRFWKKNKVFFCDIWDFSKPKYYVLDMFPYPSGNGLHVGHPRGFTASDAIARMRKMQGFNVLHPMGWDAFGLPAEQFAIKNNVHPNIFTKKNIKNFKKQIEMLGFSYDWSKEISTADPNYYKWTQYIFLKFFKNNLAYIDNIPVNFCPKLNTVLANEEVINGKSERGGYPVIRKNMRQWLLKITAYADKLLDGLNEIDWPKSTIEMQKNWIGKSFGTKATFNVKDSDEKFEIFSTRIDTIFACAYCVLSPEHSIVKKITSISKKKEVDDYVKKTLNKNDLDRTDLNKDKTGVLIGRYAINPINNKEIPIYIADYVLPHYGTGAVMGVPAHDERDYEFAKKYKISFICVIHGDIQKGPILSDGIHINSNFADGLNIDDAKKKITEKLISLKKGCYYNFFKLRDWIFSRQRYWGEPIPIIFENNKLRAVNIKDLPLRLPKINNFLTNADNKSPLENNSDWVNVKLKNGKIGKRDTNTMPQWAGSSWYYIRYLDPHNNKTFCQRKLLEHWLPVDMYIGGSEHAVLHLLYARFWHKFLYDLKLVNCPEPFKKLFHQGMILGENNEKMSKSRGNVINPDDIVKKYGADTLRLYEMFMGPLDSVSQWKNANLKGANNFINRVWKIFTDKDLRLKWTDINNHELDYIYNLTVKKITDDFNNLHFNTAISQMMIFINNVYDAKEIYKEYMINFLKMFSCICPFVSEELYSSFGNKESIYFAKWPLFDKKKIILDKIKIVLSINGKLKTIIEVDNNLDVDKLKNIALNNDIIKKKLNGLTVKKVIVIKNKIVNFVV